MTNTRLLFSFLRLLQIHPDVMLSHPHNIHRRQLLVIIWNSVVNVELNVYEIYNIAQCDVRLNVLDGRATVGGTSLLFKSSKYFPTKFSRFVEILAHSHSYVNSSLRANSMCIVQMNMVACWWICPWWCWQPLVIFFVVCHNISFLWHLPFNFHILMREPR